MFSAFLSFFKRSHTAASEPKITTVDQLRDSVSQVTQSLAMEPAAAQGLKAEMLSDPSSWASTGAHGEHPAKYEAFAARITRIGVSSTATNEFTPMAPAEPAATPSSNSFAAFVARVPDSVQHALDAMHAKKPTAPRSEQAAGEPASPPVDLSPTRIPSHWDIPPLR